jgi:Uncharacterised nucleotidyltransferase
MSAGPDMLSPEVVQEALRTTTERLAHELAQPIGTAPQWSEFEWRAARASAAIHGVGPLLASTLRWRGPPGWQEFLAAQRAHTQCRHGRIEGLAKLIDERARQMGIPMVALKGAALHALGFYAPGERPMADLDFLLEEPHMPAATALLEEQRFSEELHYWRNRVFTPSTTPRSPRGLGEHRDNPIKVELHWRIRERLPLEPIDISETVYPSSPEPGFNPYPSLAALLMHLVLHAAGAMVCGELRLIHLHDLALVCARMGEEDWEVVLRQGQPGEAAPWWFFPPLQLAGRYYSNVVPGAVLAALQRGCPSRLRRSAAPGCLTDVSLSSVWVRAFPGIEWSRSPSEAFRYMLGRVRPNAEARRIRRIDAANAAWASDSKWQGLSQRSRILRWMTSRPTRPATMYVIRETLAQPL